MPATRATSEATAPGSIAAATIRSFSARDQCRRRCTDVITSTCALVIGVALAPGSDLRPPGHQSRSLDTGRLGGPRRLCAAAGSRAAAGGLEGLVQALCRRDHGAGARSGAWTYQDRSAVGVRAR